MGTLCKVKPVTKRQILYDSVYVVYTYNEASRVIKLIGTPSRIMVDNGCPWLGEGENEFLNGCRVLVLQNEKVLEIG